MNIAMLVTIIVELFCICISLKKNHNDIFQPSIMTQISVFVGTIICAYYIDQWDDKMFYLTAIILCIGFLTLMLTSMLAPKIKISEKYNEHKEFTFDYRIILFSTAISIICTVLYGYNAYKIGLLNGGTGVNAFAYMKEAYLQDKGFKMNPIIRQTFKIVMAIAYVNSFVLFKNILYTHIRRINKYCVLSIILAVIITIFSGSRTEILKILSAIVFIFSVVYRDYIGWNNRTNTKTYKETFKKFLPIIILLLMFVFYTKLFVKTRNVEISQTTSAWDYFMYYFGSPIEVLNIKTKLVFSEGGLLFGTDNSKQISSAQVYLGNLNYGGNVGTIFASVFSIGLLLTIGYYFTVFMLLDSLYKTYIYSKETSLYRDKKIIIFSLFYFIPIMSFYSNCVNISINASSLITLLLTLFYFESIRRIKI